MAQYIDNQVPNGRSGSPILAIILVVALIILGLLFLPQLFANDADTTVNVSDTSNPSGMQSGMMPQSSDDSVVPVVNTTINSTTTTTTGTTTR